MRSAWVSDGGPWLHCLIVHRPDSFEGWLDCRRRRTGKHGDWRVGDREPTSTLPPLARFPTARFSMTTSLAPFTTGLKGWLGNRMRVNRRARILLIVPSRWLDGRPAHPPSAPRNSIGCMSRSPEITPLGSSVSFRSSRGQLSLQLTE